jgi:hypothetical protein
MECCGVAGPILDGDVRSSLAPAAR